MLALDARSLRSEQELFFSFTPDLAHRSSGPMPVPAAGRCGPGALAHGHFPRAGPPLPAGHPHDRPGDCVRHGLPARQVGCFHELVPLADKTKYVQVLDFFAAPVSCFSIAYLRFCCSGYMHGDLSAVNVLLTDSHDSTPEGAAPAPRWSSAGAPSTEASTGPAGGSVVLQRLQRGWVAKVSSFYPLQAGSCTPHLDGWAEGQTRYCQEASAACIDGRCCRM